MRVVMARTKLQVNCLEPDGRSAVTLHQEPPHRGRAAGTVPNPAQSRVDRPPAAPRLSFHSCNYDIFSDWSLYDVWATCIHHSLSHGDANAVEYGHNGVCMTQRKLPCRCTSWNACYTHRGLRHVAVFDVCVFHYHSIKTDRCCAPCLEGG
jgi:hypothetical protein